MKKYMIAVITVLVLSVASFSTDSIASEEPTVEARGKTGFDQG